MRPKCEVGVDPETRSDSASCLHMITYRRSRDLGAQKSTLVALLVRQNSLLFSTTFGTSGAESFWPTVEIICDGEEDAEGCAASGSWMRGVT